MKITICIIFILAICGMNVVSADTMCESLHSYDAEKGMQALQKSLKMVEPLLNTDCYTEQDLCDAIAFTIEKMMSHADRIVNASTVTTDNGKCRKCNMNKLYDFAVEADSAIEFLRRKGYSYRGISHVQRYDQLTRTTSRCNEEYAYPGPGIPAGPTVVVKKPFKDTREKKNPWAKIMGWEDCDEIFRRMEAGEQVEPNNCGLTKDVARGGLPKHKTSQKKQSVPDKPSWSNGCVEKSR